MKLIVLLLRRGGWACVFATIANIVSGISTVALISTIHVVLRVGFSNSMAARFVGFLLLMVVGGALGQILITSVVQKTISEIRSLLCNDILRARLYDIEIIGASKLRTVLSEDVAVIGLAAASLPTIVRHVVTVLLFAGYMFILNVQVTLGILSCLLLASIAGKATLVSMRKLQIKNRELNDLLYKNFDDWIAGTKELKLNEERAASMLENRISPSIEMTSSSAIAINKMRSIRMGWKQCASFSVIAILLFFATRFEMMTKPMLMTFVIMFLYLRAPMDAVLEWIPSLDRAMIAFSRVEQIQRLRRADNHDKSLAASKNHRGFEHSIELRGVTHHYQTDFGSGFTLGPIDLMLEPGTITFLIGGNGSGKSTLSKLLTGLYEPETGALFMDGQRVTNANVQHYRNCFSAIFADYHLFDDIPICSSEAQKRDDLAKQYLVKLGLDRKVKIHNGTFSTTKLSSGQKKRLALISAFLEDRPAYVFDEWASDQDPAFKRVFYNEILVELKIQKKLVFVITHDEQYFDVADRVVKLDFGKIVSDLETAPAGKYNSKLPA